MAKRGTGNIFTNLDNQLSDAEWFTKEKEERNLHRWVNDIENAPRHLMRGQISPGDRILIDKEQESVSVSEVREMRNKNKPIIPAFYIEDAPVLRPEEMKAVELGYACEHCLTWQKNIADLKCESLNGFSCGWERKMV